MTKAKEIIDQLESLEPDELPEVFSKVCQTVSNKGILDESLATLKKDAPDDVIELAEWSGRVAEEIEAQSANGDDTQKPNEDEEARQAG